jgi:hypothetical protein
MYKEPKPPVTIKKSSTEEERTMDAFRKEVDAHFFQLSRDFGGSYDSMPTITPRELTMADAVMWNRVKNYTKGSVTPADLEAYRRDIAKHRNPSRTELESSIAGALVTFWMREEEE